MRFFHFVVDCLDFMGKCMHLLFLPFFGTSDQPCWLAEACRFTLLLQRNKLLRPAAFQLA